MSEASSSPRQHGAESDESSDEASRPSQHTRRLADAPKDVHQPGSIVRIRMKNFVTYSSAEFKCGPNLNMIIGPNGTGKSSLVCAICLGLGWPPTFLGRAKEIGEFVKNGSREAEIEIELKAGTAQKGRNPIVKRVIRREGNKTAWCINGSSCALKDVQRLARQFNIQVDNLCQFLPQDRVVEFAGLTPVQLLDQTQKAVGTEQMLEWHASLKSLGEEKKKRVVNKESIAQHLQDLQKIQARQKADVDRMQERVQLVRRLDALEKYRPCIQTGEHKKAWETSKAAKANAAALLKQLVREVQPSVQDVADKTAYRDQIKTVLEHHKKMLDSSRRKADRTAKEAADCQESMNNCDDRINSKRKAKAERKKTIAAIQSKIAHLEAKLKSPPPEFSEQELNEKRRGLSGEHREAETQISDMQHRTNALFTSQKSLRTRHDRVKAELEELSTKSGQQKQKLKQRSRDTYRAWQWIEEHRDEFQGEVFGPPMISCSVRRPTYADAIETAMQQNDFLALTVTHPADFKMLSNKLYNDLGLQDITIRTSSRSLSQWQRPVDNTRLVEFGFDGWLVDGLEGPDAVLSMLCGSARLNSCAFTTKALSDERLKQLHNSPIQQWCTKDELCSIQRRREYGPQAVSTMVRRLFPARCWTDQGIDSSRQAELEAERAQLAEEMVAARETVIAKQTELDEIKAKRNRLRVEITAITEEKERLQRARSDWEGVPVKIDGHQAELERKLADQAETDGEMKELMRKKEELALDRAKMALTYAGDMQRVRTAVKELLRVELVLMEAESDRIQLETRNRDVIRLLEEKRRELAEVKVETKRLFKIYESHHRMYQNIVQELDADAQTIHAELMQRTPKIEMDELEADITSARQRIELVSPGNPRILAEYQKRARDIEQQAAELARTESEEGELGRRIADIRGRWEPRLDRLVARISDAFAFNFEQIRCAGQVSLHKDEDDFEKWAILIHVKFRENEQLSVLNSQRQSGGERAVSTIFYLMALQALARAPFRVVDEINQGMDPRNERLVHERMVAVACADVGPRRAGNDVGGDDDGDDGLGGGSQYFLITPKLLTGLRYHERMVVHAIYSGESMPDESAAGASGAAAGGPVLDLGALAGRALKVMGKA